MKNFMIMKSGATKGRIFSRTSRASSTKEIITKISKAVKTTYFTERSSHSLKSIVVFQTTLITHTIFNTVKTDLYSS